MPVIVDPDGGSVRRLLGALPPGCQSVDSTDRLLPWLAQHTDEYVVVLGPNVRFEDAVAVCEGLRVSRPMTGVVLVRESFDTQTLARAMQAGAREVDGLGDTDSIAGAVTRAAWARPRSRSTWPSRSPTRATGRSVWWTSTWPSGTSPSRCSSSRRTRSS